MIHKRPEGTETHALNNEIFFMRGRHDWENFTAMHFP